MDPDMDSDSDCIYPAIKTNCTGFRARYYDSDIKNVSKMRARTRVSSGFRSRAAEQKGIRIRHSNPVYYTYTLQKTFSLYSDGYI